jgi:hypothetical protein
MRKFLIFLTVLAIAGYVYTHKNLWNKFTGSVQAVITAPTPAPPPVPTMADKPYAFRMWGRVSADSLTLRRFVVVVNGERWRYESKDSNSSKTTVAVCDGSHPVANPDARESAVSLDPRAMMARIFMAAAVRPAIAPPP